MRIDPITGEEIDGVCESCGKRDATHRVSTAWWQSTDPIRFRVCDECEARMMRRPRRTLADVVMDGLQVAPPAE